VCVRLPEVPVIVSPMVIGAAVLVAEKVSVLVPPLLIGPNDAVRPAGNPGCEKLTLPVLKPPEGMIVSVVDPLAP